MNIRLMVGAGGHARCVAEMFPPDAYVALNECDWLRGAVYYAAAAFLPDQIEKYSNVRVSMGMGGTHPDALKHRVSVAEKYRQPNVQFPPVLHTAALVSRRSEVLEGAQVLAGAVLNPNVRLDPFCIVNIGALIAHDCVIGQGSHIGPGAVLCQGVNVGRCSMIGAGAIVLADVPDETLVKSLTRHQ